MVLGQTLLAEQNEAKAPKEHVDTGSKAQDHGFQKRYTRSLSAPVFWLVGCDDFD